MNSEHIHLCRSMFRRPCITNAGAEISRGFQQTILTLTVWTWNTHILELSVLFIRVSDATHSQKLPFNTFYYNVQFTLFTTLD